MFDSKCSFILGLVAFSVLNPVVSAAEEVFATIQKVEGSRLTIVKEANEGRGGRRGGGTGRRAGGAPAQSQTVIQIPQNTKITSAIRERRTQKLSVGVEIPGGLKHPIFQNLKQPLSARIVYSGQKITELNVITSDQDINQTSLSPSGVPDIAVRPKRPPMKK